MDHYFSHLKVKGWLSLSANSILVILLAVAQSCHNDSTVLSLYWWVLHRPRLVIKQGMRRTCMLNSLEDRSMLTRSIKRLTFQKDFGVNFVISKYNWISWACLVFPIPVNWMMCYKVISLPKSGFPNFFLIVIISLRQLSKDNILLDNDWHYNLALV